MNRKFPRAAWLAATCVVTAAVLRHAAPPPTPPPVLPDAVEDAHSPKAMPGNRPEQKKNVHDQSGIFDSRRMPNQARPPFSWRGIKESPPYLHEGRCLTLEDTVEFFNLVLETKLNSEEQSDFVAFPRVL